MKFFLLTLFVTLTIVHAKLLREEFVQGQWLSFKSDYDREYETSVEEKYRYNIFEDNLMKIHQHNKLYRNGESSYEMGVNQFADLLNSEYQRQTNCYKPMPRHHKHHSHEKVNESDENSSIDEVAAEVPRDFVAIGALNPIQNQSTCGGCWAFAAVSVIESLQYLRRRKLVKLSEQQVIDCAPEADGCDGGNPKYAYKYIMSVNGITLASKYPYESRNGNCHYTKNMREVTVDKYFSIKQGDEIELQRAAVTNPVAAGIDASTDGFRFYKQGVLNDPKCRNSMSSITHSITIVGFAITEKGEKYWKIRNTWGESWGLKGYAYMARQQNNNCAIATDASYASIL